MSSEAVTEYKKRTDGRKFDEIREMKAKVGVVARADGSAMFSMGNTIAIAAVYGPKELHPKFLQNPRKGILRVYYQMMPFSGHGNRVRPGNSRRGKEIMMVCKNALLPVLDLSEYPNSVVDVFVYLPQTDAGTRCCAINAASMALADAGLTMRDMVSSLSMGWLAGNNLADVNGEEDCELGATDIPLAYIPKLNKVSLLQLDGPMTRENLKKILEDGKKHALTIYNKQKEALKAKYTGEQQ